MINAIVQGVQNTRVQFPDPLTVQEILDTEFDTELYLVSITGDSINCQDIGYYTIILYSPEIKEAPVFRHWVERGLVHKTARNAEIHAKALIDLNRSFLNYRNAK